MTKDLTPITDDPLWVVFSKEWAPTNQEKPETFSTGSNKEVLWICSEGHEYEKAPKQRFKRNFGCPICTNRKIVDGVNDLLTLYPHLKNTFDFEKNTKTIYAGKTYDVIWWTGIPEIGCTHSFQQAVRSRVENIIGCSDCSSKLRAKKIQSRLSLEQKPLMIEKSDYLSLWDYKRNERPPFDFSPGSAKMAFWLCNECGTSFKQRIIHRLKSPLVRPCCETYRRYSKAQNEISHFLKKEIGFPFLENSRSILSDGTELDFFFPELGIAIEYNGGEGWFHARKSEYLNGSKKALRELTKDSVAKKDGIKLLQLWESDGMEFNKKSLWKFVHDSKSFAEK